MPDKEPDWDLTGTKILIVDDNADNREMLQTYLGHCRATTVSAPDVPRAVAYLRTMQFDVVISDIAMHGGDGFDLIKHLRSTENMSRHTFAIALTGYPFSHDRLIQAGYDIHFLKPLDLDIVAAAIANRPRIDSR